MKEIYEKKSIIVNNDKRLSSVVLWVMIGLLLTNASALFSSEISSYVSLISKLVLIVFLLRCVRVFKPQIAIEMFWLYFFFFIFFSVSFFTLKEGSGYYQILAEFLFNVFPLTYVIFMMNDFTYLMEKMECISKVIIIVSVVFVCVSNSSTQYYMGFANALVVPIVALLQSYFNNQRYDQLLFACLGIVIILFVGSRGALLPIIVYFVIKLFKSLNDINNNKINFLITIVLIVSVVFKNSVIQFTYNFLNRFGIHSRTMYLLVNDTWHTSGRDIIQDAILEELFQHPFAFRGIGSDYIVTGGAYAHNILLEILVQFGVVIGGLLLVVLFILMIRTIINASKSSFNEYRLMMMCSSIPLLMVSGSFWRSFYFWIWVVMCIRKEGIENERTKITKYCSSN